MLKAVRVERRVLRHRVARHQLADRHRRVGAQRLRFELLTQIVGDLVRRLLMVETGVKCDRNLQAKAPLLAQRERGRRSPPTCRRTIDQTMMLLLRCIRHTYEAM